MAEKKRLRSIAVQQREALQFQRTFLGKIAPEDYFQTVLNHLDDLQVVIKDAAGRFVWLTDNVARRYGFAHALEMVGSDDFASNPTRLARMYHRDDMEVIRSGKPLLGKIEPVFDPCGLLKWHVTSKFPLRDRRGRVAGLIVIIREQSVRADGLFLGDLQPVVAYVHAHLAERLCTSDLAKVAGVSRRQIERRFRDAAGMSPAEFINRARLDEACRHLRETEDSIAKISGDVGFYDQSALSRLFRRYLGVSPRDFRKARSGAH
jgi:AraC-like DNA-binding protein